MINHSNKKIKILKLKYSKKNFIFIYYLKYLKNSSTNLFV